MLSDTTNLAREMELHLPGSFCLLSDASPGELADFCQTFLDRACAAGGAAERERCGNIARDEKISATNRQRMAMTDREGAEYKGAADMAWVIESKIRSGK